MYNTNFNRLAILFFILVTAVSVNAEQISLGGSDGWASVVLTENIIRQGGDSNSKYLLISDNEYSPSQSADLLLHFNDGIRDECGNYTVKNNTGIELSSWNSRRGGGAAVFRGEGEILELLPGRRSAFAAGGGISDFSIEFWLNPVRLSEGETILRWQGAAETPTDTLQQEILCAVSGRNIFWQFRNFFLSPEMDETMFTLHPEMALIPGNWHHHLIRFDRNSGLLEYLIDGVPEAVVYVSRSGGEDSEIFTPAPGRAAPSVLKLGRGFTGYLDELRITNAFVDSPLLERYGMTSGIAATEIIDLGNYDSRLLSIDSTESVPGNTRIDYYYRISNRWFAPEADSPSWKQILPGETLSPGIDGRYLQIMTELFPDGDGERSPSLSELKISYNRNLPPLPSRFRHGRGRRRRGPAPLAEGQRCRHRRLPDLLRKHARCLLWKRFGRRDIAGRRRKYRQLQDYRPRQWKNILFCCKLI